MLQIAQKKQLTEEEKTKRTEITLYFNEVRSANKYIRTLNLKKGTLLELKIYNILNEKNSNWASKGHKLGKDKHVPATFFIEGSYIDNVFEKAYLETRDITKHIGTTSYTSRGGFYTTRAEGNDMVVHISYIPTARKHR